MATRMQQRRGTASQWTSANPVLNAAEMGWESDTNKFKIGDGTNHWADLDYFVDTNSTINPAFGTSIVFEGTTANDFETTLAITDPTEDRTITFPNVSGTVITTGNLSDITDIGVFSGSITMEGTTADSYELTIAAGDPTEDRTISFPDASGTVALIETVNTSLGGYIETSDIGGVSGVVGLDSNLNAIIPGTSIIIEGATDNTNETTLTVTDPTSDRTITFPDATGTVALTTDIPSSTTAISEGTNLYFTNERAQDAVSTALAAGTHTNITVTYNDEANSISLSAAPGYSDENAQDAIGNAVGTGLSYNDTTGAISVDTTTIQARVTDVSDTEIGYLNGVTSAIQTQLDDKLSKTGGTMTGALTLSADPSSSLHAATKQYVDNTASGVVAKPSVLGATTANIDATYSNGTAGVGATLTHNTNGAFPAEAGGVTGWAVGKGILVKNQTNKAHNGRYFVSDMGSASTPYVLTRCTYCDEASEIPGAYIFVQGGTLAGTGWIQVVADPATFVVGTDNIDVFQFSGSGTITAGTGITVSGNQVSINTTTTADLSTAQTLTNKTISGANNTLTVRLANDVSGTLPIANGGTGATTASTAAAALLPAQASNSGKYLTTDGSGTLSWGTVSGYLAPTLGSTSIGSGATVTTIAGLTLTSPVLNTPTLTLSTSTSTTEGVIAWNSTLDKIIVGDGTTAREFASSTMVTNAQGASYTTVLADKDKIIEMNVGSANNLTIPLNSSVAYPIGTVINVVQTGTGQTTVVATGGVTINGTPGLKLRAQWSAASVIKRAENTWVLLGDIAA